MDFYIVKQRLFTSSLATIMITGLLFTLPLSADQPVDSIKQTNNHQQAIEAWRTSRHERLEQPNGWLTLVGLEWLKDGKSSIGSAEDNDIQLIGGSPHWGHVFLQEDGVRFVSSDTENVSINGEPLSESKLVADVEGEPTIVASGSLSFYAIFRGSYGLRVKDTQAAALQQFKGVENYPIQKQWQVDGRFIEAEEGTTIEITNVLGLVGDSPVFGTLEFEHDGKTHSLLGLGEAESESLWFIFSDRTSGRGTYGAGRFLYSDGMPANGRLTVDFNKAYNPPCAFNPYSTCPLPPQRNRMDLMVTAGEKDFHPASD